MKINLGPRRDPIIDIGSNHHASKKGSVRYHKKAVVITPHKRRMLKAKPPLPPGHLEPPPKK